MADYHHVYESAEKEDTEWEAIHRRLGNLPAKPVSKPPPKFEPQTEAVKDQMYMDNCTTDELDDLEDDFADDAAFEAYRKARLMELKTERPLEFGSVTEVEGEDFVREVTEASRQTWVVVLLYASGHLKCQDLERCLEELASDFPSTKFVKMPAEACIPGYPKQHLPTVLVYWEGSCKKNLVGMDAYRPGRLTAEAVMEALNAIGPVCK